MVKKDKRIDAYIAKAQPFAKPVLNHIRSLVHKACPDAEETMKWSFPHFNYKGTMMCSMASFKQHVAFGFWKASIMKDPKKMLNSSEAMGHLGRITSVKDLPADNVMIQYIKEAARLNEEGVKLPSKPVKEKKKLVIPDYLIKAISKNKEAKKTFDEFSYSNKKEYVEWITEAKTEDTRNNRLTTAVEWMAESKVRNWKYLKC
ncbi:MAG TPA: YdeI/OmpD-associated family protein [Ignavibacteria bacterium]|nr:YdeI/OmpD-associated family protein [Ignavibacteria bacterium]